MNYDVIVERAGLRAEDAAALAARYGQKVYRFMPGAMRFDDLDPHTAAELAAHVDADAGFDTDVFVVKASLSVSEIRLMCFDMDSTLVEEETLDAMAERTGCGEAVRAITQAAMTGTDPVSFAQSLEKRCELLAGTPVSVLEEVTAGLTLMPGAEALMAFCRAHRIDTYILSGGFGLVTRSVAERLGMTGAISNEIAIENGKLTGRVQGPGNGKIQDADGKRRALEVLCALHGCTLGETLCAGDGANDLQMVRAARLGVAFRAKPVLRSAAPLRLNHGGLDALTRLFRETWEGAETVTAD